MVSKVGIKNLNSEIELTSEDSKDPEQESVQNNIEQVRSTQDSNI